MSQHINTPGDSSNSKQSKDTKKKSKRKVADTSIEAWIIINERKQPQREGVRVYQMLSKIQPATSRRLGEILNLERGNITRCLKDLENAELIKVAYKAKCPVTNMKVKHYAKVDWKPEEKEEVSNEQ